MERPIVAVAKSDNQQNDVKSHDVIGDINKHVVKLVFKIKIQLIVFVVMFGHLQFFSLFCFFFLLYLRTISVQAERFTIQVNF